MSSLSELMCVENTVYFDANAVLVPFDVFMEVVTPLMNVKGTILLGIQGTFEFENSYINDTNKDSYVEWIEQEIYFWGIVGETFADTCGQQVLLSVSSASSECFWSRLILHNDDK